MINKTAQDHIYTVTTQKYCFPRQILIDIPIKRNATLLSHNIFIFINQTLLVFNVSPTTVQSHLFFRSSFSLQWMKWKTRSELHRIAEEDKGLSADPLHLYELLKFPESVNRFILRSKTRGFIFVGAE